MLTSMCVDCNSGFNSRACAGQTLGIVFRQNLLDRSRIKRDLLIGHKEESAQLIDLAKDVEALLHSK